MAPLASLGWELSGHPVRLHLQSKGFANREACSLPLGFNAFALVGVHMHMGIIIHGLLHAVAETWKQPNECPTHSETLGHVVNSEEQNQ